VLYVIDDTIETDFISNCIAPVWAKGDDGKRYIFGWRGLNYFDKEVKYYETSNFKDHYYIRSYPHELIGTNGDISDFSLAWPFLLHSNDSIVYRPVSLGIHSGRGAIYCLTEVYDEFYAEWCEYWEPSSPDFWETPNFYDSFEHISWVESSCLSVTTPTLEWGTDNTKFYIDNNIVGVKGINDNLSFFEDFNADLGLNLDLSADYALYRDKPINETAIKDYFPKTYEYDTDNGYPIRKQCGCGNSDEWILVYDKWVPEILSYVESGREILSTDNCSPGDKIFYNGTCCEIAGSDPEVVAGSGGGLTDYLTCPTISFLYGTLDCGPCATIGDNPPCTCSEGIPPGDGVYTCDLYASALEQCTIECASGDFYRTTCDTNSHVYWSCSGIHLIWSTYNKNEEVNSESWTCKVPQETVQNCDTYHTKTWYSRSYKQYDQGSNTYDPVEIIEATYEQWNGDNFKIDDQYFSS